MPRGVYTRRQRKPVRKTATKSARRKRGESVAISLVGLESESEFLTHGSTHARERAKDYDSLKRSSLIMARFIANMALLNQSIPEPVRAAAASVIIT